MMLSKRDHLRLGVLAGLWFALGAGTAGAQQRPGIGQDPCRPSDWAPDDVVRVDPSCFGYNTFQMRGLGDFAGTGLKSQDTNSKFFVTNSGPSDTGLEMRPFFPSSRGNPNIRGRISSTAYTFTTYNIQFYAAVSRSDWLRNRELVPTLRNVKGGGFASIQNQDRLGGVHNWQGADGSVGRLHSGEQAAAVGCFDHGAATNDFPYGFPLMAGSNCPETWGSLGWVGRRWEGPIENWIRYFNAVGSSDFSFDFRHMPQQYWQVADRPTTVSDNFQTYGSATDWGQDARRMYGNVVPGGAGEPQWDGYPIGLTLEFNIYSFGVPAVSGGFIHEAHIINDSEKVYGVPLDYDSMWFGWWPATNVGYAWHYALPERGAVIWGQSGHVDLGTPSCTGYQMRAVPDFGNCGTGNTTRGMRNGGFGIMFLRTPLGDLRNKHFSDPDSPFYAPNHELAGDTITFNRNQGCEHNYCMQNQIIPYGVRAGYGMIAADPVAVLAGRDPATIEPRERFVLFPGQLYDDEGNFQYCRTSAPRGPGCFSYVVPGEDNYQTQITRQPSPTWTYTNRPPGAPIGPDTLWLAGCRLPGGDHPARNRCPELYTDSTSDRTRAFTGAGHYSGAGPFPLKAGDTVPYVVAYFQAPLESQWVTMDAALGKPVPGPIIEDWYNFYIKDFYLGPSQPPPPGIINIATRGGSTLFGTSPQVVLFLNNATESWRDAYTLKLISDLRNPTPGTFPAQVAAADPGAADRLLLAIDRNIVDSIYVYKSCDFGRSVTAAAALRCDPSPARSPTRTVLGDGGWQAYTWLVPDAQGRFPKSITDNNVAGGMRYIYTMVATTKGVEFATQYRLANGTIRDTTLTIVRPGRTPFSLQSGSPWVADVYVPLQPQAGAAPARVEVTREEGQIRWYRQISTTFFANTAAPGSYRLVFGKEAQIREYRQVGSRTVDSTVVTLAREALSVLPSGDIQRLDIAPRVFRSLNPYGISIGGVDSLIVRSTQTTGTQQVITTLLNRKTGLLLDAATGNVLFASNQITSGNFTPADFSSHPAFRGFRVGVTDAATAFTVANAGSYIGQSWRSQGLTLRADATPSVTHLRGTGQIATGGLRYGTWSLQFRAPFFARYEELPQFDVNNPQRTADAYYSMLERRAVGSRTEVSDRVLTAIRRRVNPALTMDDLIEVKLPFFVQNLEFGEGSTGSTGEGTGRGSPVIVAMLKTSKISRVTLGFGVDTVSADVPPDAWIPGEPFMLLEEVDLAVADETSPGVFQTRLDANGEPVMTRELRVTMITFMLGCSGDARITCNPLRGPGRAGMPGHVEVRPIGDPDFPEGWETRIAYNDLITSQSAYEFRVFPEQLGRNTPQITQSMLDAIRVVPNPYLIRSNFNYVADVRRIMWTSLPPSGSIHILTASGQYVQRLDWEPEDLRGTGDLAWNLNTKEATEVAAGVYMYVLETIDPASGNKLSRTGKFIIIK